MADTHPLLPMLICAAQGHFPPVDGAVTYLPPLERGIEAVVAFTGHAVVCSRWGREVIEPLGADGYGQAHRPEVLSKMAEPDRTVGVLDATLVRRGPAPTGASALPRRTDREQHHRVRHARAIRTDVDVYGDERGLVTIGRGLAGRWEISIEVEPEGQGHGWGRSLLADGLATAPAGEWLFAAVSPGNARSLRLILAAEFVPIGSEVIIQPAATPTVALR